MELSKEIYEKTLLKKSIDHYNNENWTKIKLDEKSYSIQCSDEEFAKIVDIYIYLYNEEN